MTRKEINDLLLSIHNRCHWLRDSKYEREEWHRFAPTLIEDIFVDAQKLLDSYCAVRDGINDGQSALSATAARNSFAISGGYAEVERKLMGLCQGTEKARHDAAHSTSP